MSNAISWQAARLAVFCALLAPTQVWAHAFLDRAEPAVGGTLKEAPAEVRVYFTEQVEATFSRLQVFDAVGREVDAKNARVDPKDGRRLSVSLRAGLGAGTYKVVWRAVSVDTHVTGGEFTFRVES